MQQLAQAEPEAPCATWPPHTLECTHAAFDCHAHVLACYTRPSSFSSKPLLLARAHQVLSRTLLLLHTDRGSPFAAAPFLRRRAAAVGHQPLTKAPAPGICSEHQHQSSICCIGSGGKGRKRESSREEEGGRRRKRRRGLGFWVAMEGRKEQLGWRLGIASRGKEERRKRKEEREKKEENGEKEKEKTNYWFCFIILGSKGNG